MLKKFNFFLIIFSDKILSLFLLIIFSPFLFIIYFLLFIFNSGSVFYISERIGFKNKPFKLIKFKTMKDDLNEEITKIGKFLRRSSLDELPQLINVLKGDMSLVGPRPYPLKVLSNIDNENNFLRHKVRPGITGYSQIFFSGKKRSLEEKIAYDIHFVKNYNLLFYYLIIIKTPLTIIKRYILNPSGKTL